MRRAGRPGPLARSAAQRQRSTMRSGQFLLPPQSPSAAASRQRRGHSPRMLSQRAGAAGCRAAHGTRPSAPLRGPLHAPRAHPAPPLSLRPAPLTGTPPFLLLLSRRSRRSFPAAARAAAALGGPRGAQRGPLPPPPLTGRAPPGPAAAAPERPERRYLRSGPAALPAPAGVRAPGQTGQMRQGRAADRRGAASPGTGQEIGTWENRVDRECSFENSHLCYRSRGARVSVQFAPMAVRKELRDLGKGQCGPRDRTVQPLPPGSVRAVSWLQTPQIML